jgi:hypothetical protein
MLICLLSEAVGSFVGPKDSTSSRTNTPSLLEQSLNVSKISNSIDRPRRVIVILAPGNPYEAKQVYTITFEDGPPFSAASKQGAQWPCLSFKGLNKRGETFWIANKLAAILSGISEDVLESRLKQYKLVVAKDEMVQKAEEWTANAFDSIVAYPAMFKRVESDEKGSYIYLANELDRGVKYGCAYYPHPVVVGYLVDKETGEFVCFYTAEERW